MSPPLSSNDIRQAYLDFFRENDHAVIPGAPLIPENDPTVLFTTAGMHPLVPYLLGETHPAGNRLVDVQRCLRTQDIDEVGDASHLTCFEMMGNWSLGDYFKEGAIQMSFEFLTEVLEIPKDMLSISCFAGDADAPKDEEAAELWKSVGIPQERIAFLPKSENWWGPAGQTGPCGPDTEMFYWVGKGEPHDNPGVNEQDWMEIWNDVFMQYNKNEHGKFTPLTQQNVDTGMGLERTAAVMQKVKNVYEIDVLKPIVGHILRLHDDVEEQVSGTVKEETLRHARIMTDHLRAAVFIIGDGVRPGNVDQGYILRRLIRRAIRSARALGIEHSGMLTPAIAETVVQQYGDYYGHLREHEKEIRDVLSHEELQFGRALNEGLKQFQRAVEKAGDTLDGETAFHLYDTYGFPIEMTQELAAENHMKVDRTGFEKAFEAHQDLSRKGAEQKFSGGLADHSAETTKLHTATHLLNAALRKILGDHVYQKGSNITTERLRFDFSHDEKMTPEQVQQVEDLVNKAIREDLPVSYHLTTVEKAKEENAIGVFDERYGSEVKVYVIGNESITFSKEICGGPHVARTGMLGSFEIKKEESSSAGVRRIKAVVEGGPEEIEVAQQKSC
ncbi:alanine--tRNA ligase [Candidatus Peregrinibacteria bacterium CG10_big_fil_rev_8_21_14_0_10_49_10]|nr:MAG: alanine--tRNA ligase [Candidatus Peregrinibacteria bacterium CG10_big_fil_rev_8_21_14_0_10_49_10]